MKTITSIPRRINKGFTILRRDGFFVLTVLTLEKIRRVQGFRHKVNSLAKIDDLLIADWSVDKSNLFSPGPVSKKSYTINWIMSPPGKGSGGHQNLFRFIRFTEQAGHKSNIYLYTTIDKRTLDEIKAVLDDSYPKVSAEISWLDDGMEDADCIFATGWETAYPAFNSKMEAQRFYFVQDFEPYFNAVGSEYILAENTYRFGFFGITAGGWLSKKLRNEYSMQTDHFDFGVDKSLYVCKNKSARKEVFFYARPVTARRGFELGIMALEQFHKKHPDYKINLAGWDVSDYDIPFPYENLMTMPLKDLSAVYNRCSVALVMSLTNMSLMPLELIACGTIPVVNDAPNNRLVSNNPYIEFSPNNPSALANSMSKIVTKKNLPEYALKASESVAKSTWDESGKKFVQILERKLRNG